MWVADARLVGREGDVGEQGDGGLRRLGLGIVLRDLWPISLRAVALSCVATATVTVTAVPLVPVLIAGAA